jgi:ABC-2 type transport system permease protein
LSYAIEPIRYLYLHDQWSLGDITMSGPFGEISFGGALLILAGFTAVSLAIVQPLLRRRFA